ncbi:hypothetical protein E2C01_074329 [Portunus trituberculatus]|uniref:Endonuclease/exonuclease/phosphatase domain-containing protein n=1 Tax=Portunus trituberculatus TaxID=210409 RepID=A0A5B7IBV6_PORTR|nr:hypothetical protein [Portunus trituberculatus]
MLDFIGTSDHEAVITKVHFRRQREESFSCTLWKCEATDWGALREDLRRTDWGVVVSGDVNQQVRQFSELLLTI